MKRRTAIIAAGAIVLIGAGIVTSAGALSSRSMNEAPPAACDQRAPLVAAAQRGLPWQQHRRWLQPTDGSPLPGQSHLVHNERTGEWFRWARTEAGVDGPRYMVPTRYAEIVNRRWRDDPWSYCLVLAPEPPFRFSTGGFESVAQAQPARIVGGAAAISVSITAHRPGTVLVVIELHDAEGVPAAQWVFDRESLRGGRTVTYDVPWQPPADIEPGLYTINVGIFAAGWGPLRHWNEGSGVLLVERSGAVSD